MVTVVPIIVTSGSDALLSSEFWAAVAGAVVGGGIAAAVQWLAIRYAARDRRRSLAHSLLFKVGQIYSHLRTLRKTFEDDFSKATAEEQKTPWLILRAPVGTLARVYFSTEETALLLELKAAKALDALLSTDEKHNTLLDGLQFYTAERGGLVGQLTPEMIQGDRGVIVMPLRLEPQAIGLNKLIGDIRTYLGPDTAHAHGLLQQLATLFKAKLDIEFDATPKQETPASPNAAMTTS